MPETRDERLALAASAIIVACDGSDKSKMKSKELRTLTAGRAKAMSILMATGISPTDLKALGLRICGEGKSGDNDR